MPVEVLLMLKIDKEGKFNPGWSEKYIHLSNPDALNELEDELKELAEARAALNGYNTTITQARASRPGVFRDSFRIFSRESQEPGANFVGAGGFKTKASDQANACLNVEMANNDVQKRLLKMSGVPDDLLGTDPPGPRYALVPTWVDAWKKYEDIVTNGVWGFRARSIPREQNVVDVGDWTLESTAPFQLICQIADVNDFASVGDQVQVRGVRSAFVGAPVPNGKWQVRAKADSGGIVSMTLRGAIGFDPSGFLDTGTVEPVLYQYVASLTADITGQGTRKRGVGPVRRRGRARARRRS